VSTEANAGDTLQGVPKYRVAEIRVPEVRFPKQGVPKSMISVTIYSRPGCHLCDEMKDVVLHVASSVPLTVEEIDISGNPELEQLYGLEIPVLFVAGKKVAKYRVSEGDLRRILAARDRTP